MKYFRALIIAISLFVSAIAAAQAPPIQPVPMTGPSMQFGQLDSQNTSPLSQLIGTRPYVWNASGAQTGVVMGFYMPCCRDPVTTIASPTPHNYAWFVANHPDWPMWTSTSPNAVLTIASPCTPSTCSGGTVLPFPNTTGVAVGCAVVAPGGGLPSLDFVASVAPNTSVTLTSPITATVNSGATVNFWCPLEDRSADNIIDIDIANPAVQQYMQQYALVNGIQQGFNYISLDNVNPANSSLQLGHYAGAVPGCPAGPPACGGIFVSQYPEGESDPNWIPAVNGYVSNMRSFLNLYGFGLSGNTKVFKSNVGGSGQIALNEDFVLTESLFLRGCGGGSTTVFQDNTDGNWIANVTFLSVVGQHRPVYDLGYLCNHPAVDATNPEISWGEGNVLLTLGPQTMMSLNNTGTGTQDLGYFILYPSTMTFEIGYPTEGVPLVPNSSGGCYERTFSGGMVEVWPYPTGSCTYTVPSGHTWTDNFGNSVSAGTNNLSPDDSTGTPRANAIILLRSN